MPFTKVAAAGIDTTGSVIIQNLNTSGIITATTFVANNTGTTGTPQQTLQVSGGGYFSGSVGLGNTNPAYTLSVTSTGTTAISGLTNCIADFTTSANSYTQINIRNANSGVIASADYVATADNGNDTTNFIDLGINNSSFFSPTWTINGGNDGYLYTSDGNLSIGAAASKYLSFFTGGTLAANERARFDSSGNFLIGATSATGTASQPLQVTGGAYVSGSVGVGTTNPVSRVEIYDTSTNTYADNAGVNIGPLQIRTVNNSGIAGQTAAIRLASSSNSGTQNAVSVIANISEANASNNSSLAFQTRGSDGVVERMRINSSGNLGIGTASPPLRLSVDGGVDTTFTNLPVNLQLVNRGTIAAGLGVGINFSANYNNVIATTYAQISGARENATSGSTAGYLAFGTRDSGGGTSIERARFNSTGAFVLAGGTTTANGIGIAFPATQSASTDANTLDDYEEGTFSPTAFGSVTAGTTTYGLQYGVYVKVGQICHFQVRMQVTNMTGTGDLYLGGLPFTSMNDNQSGYASISVGYLDSLPFGNVNDTHLVCYVNANSTNIVVRSSGNNRNSTSVPVDTAFTILYGGTYRTST